MGPRPSGRCRWPPDALGVDLLSLSAHKIYGPKGIGALVLRQGIAIEPLQWGGGQEAGLRAGTLPTALIVGFAAAARLALQEQDQRNRRLQSLRDQLWEGLQQRLPGVLLNGALQPRLPHNLNISLPGVNGSRLHRALRPHLACSSGSACSNGAPSHVLQAIGRSRAEAEASLRLSLGRETTAAEVDQAHRRPSPTPSLPPKLELPNVRAAAWTPWPPHPHQRDCLWGKPFRTAGRCFDATPGHLWASCCSASAAASTLELLPEPASWIGNRLIDLWGLHWADARRVARPAGQATQLWRSDQDQSKSHVAPVQPPVSCLGCC